METVVADRWVFADVDIGRRHRPQSPWYDGDSVSM